MLFEEIPDRARRVEPGTDGADDRLRQVLRTARPRVAAAAERDHSNGAAIPAAAPRTPLFAAIAVFRRSDVALLRLPAQIVGGEPELQRALGGDDAAVGLPH